MYIAAAGMHIFNRAAVGTAGTSLSWVESMRIDAAGNVGVGVTPNTWSSGWKSLEIWGGGISSAIAHTSTTLYFASNGYHNSGWKYAGENTSGLYTISGNAHVWSVAPSGPANSAISYTTSMTLDSKGNLGLGTVTPGAWSSDYKSIEIKSAGNSIWSASQNDLRMSVNAIHNGTNYIVQQTGNATMYVQTLGNHYWYTGNGSGGVQLNAWVPTMTMNSNSILTIGEVVASPWSQWKGIQLGHSAAIVADTTTEGVAVTNNAYYNGSSWKYITNGVASIQLQGNTGNQYWYVSPISGTADADINPVELMKLSPNGNLQINCYNATESGWDGIEGIRLNGDTNAAMGIVFSKGGTTNKGYMYYAGGTPSIYLQTTPGTRIDIQSGGGGGVYLAESGTSWTGVSDERLKTDFTPIGDAVQKVSSLRAVTGRYKTDKIGTSRAFLIAQDVLGVLPEAVDTTNPDKLGVQYTDVIPLLVAAIKELSAKNDYQNQLIQELQAKVSILESK
jgi:hypothetical protein